MSVQLTLFSHMG